MTILTEPLRSLRLDERNEEQLLESAKLRVYEASQRTITDFSLSSPVTALLEGQVYAQAELAYLLSKLPKAVSIEFLKTLGVERIVGTFAEASITWRLTAPQAQTFFLPLGYSFFTQSGLEWKTTQEASIAAGNLLGVVAVRCTTVGTQGNLGPDQIRRLSVPLSFLASATNPLPAQGGLDGESDDQFFERSGALLSQRAPSTAQDYETILKTLLGEGCRARVASPRFGLILCRVLLPGSQIVAQPQLSQLQSLLQDKSMLGIRVEVQNFNIQPLDLTITLDYRPSDGRPRRSLDIETARAIRLFLLQSRPDYISVRELEYSLRTLPWIESITAIVINGNLSCQDLVPVGPPGSVPVGRTLTIIRQSEELQYDLAQL